MHLSSPPYALHAPPIIVPGGAHVVRRLLAFFRGKIVRGETKIPPALMHTQTIVINPLTPNDPYRGRTAHLTSKRCILYIYSTNIGTEYFKHGTYSVFFSSKWRLFHNSNVFGSCIINILHKGVLK